MTVYHVNDKEETRACNAKTPERCDFYRGENEPRHFTNLQEANDFAQTQLREKHGIMPRTNVRYSLTKEFKKLEEQYNKDFEGFPTRFFNADLAGKMHGVRMLMSPDSPEYDPSRKSFDAPHLLGRLAYAASEPKDGDIDTDQVRAYAEDMGFTNVEEVTDSRTLASFKVDRGWKMTTDTGNEILVVPLAGAKNMRRYIWRRKPDGFTKQKVTLIDARTLAGAHRLRRKTGVDALHLVASEIDLDRSRLRTKEEFKDNAEANEAIGITKRKATYELLMKTMEAQEEGTNFRQQKKLYRETGGTVASAWEDKKHPDKTRQAMMDNTELNKTFSKVEIDNDVDPAEFAEFERNYLEVQSKLPPIPADRRPALRLRKLGKHKASGLFAAAGPAGTICVDIRDSSSMIHETYHYYDRVTMDNISLKSEFRPLARKYRESIQFPSSMTSAKREYYTTPTEIHSRAAEIYSYERLGIQNRLVNPDRFKEFDYAPIQNNPEFKAELFKFFDEQYKTGGESEES